MLCIFIRRSINIGIQNLSSYLLKTKNVTLIPFKVDTLTSALVKLQKYYLNYFLSIMKFEQVKFYIQYNLY